MSGLRYVVLETQTDGSERVWGPFSEARADLAVEALWFMENVERARALPLVSSARLDEEVPDWKRVQS